MGQFSLIMPPFFCFVFFLKDIILWLGFYGLKKPFLKKLLMIFVKNPLWLKKFTLMFKKCGNNFANGDRKMRMATTVCEYCFFFCQNSSWMKTMKKFDGIFTKFFLNIDNNSIIHSS